jgi:hypothetical protein
MMNRYTLFGITILIGFVFAVYYGWAVRPIPAANAQPALLREDYRADYVLMVAEAYQADHNAERAIGSLGFLGSEGETYNPYAFVSDAQAFGTNNGYSVADLELLQELQAALLEFDASFAPTATP